MVVERTGKAIRNRSRDVMLSRATGSIGRGWGFGLHEALAHRLVIDVPDHLRFRVRGDDLAPRKRFGDSEGKLRCSV